MILIRNKIPSIIKAELIEYPTPLNINYFWGFGSLAGIFLVIQILTGILLAMHYTPHINYAFDSIEHIMRDVNYGWALRYIHANGASFFFFVVYIHMARGLYFTSFSSPKSHVWMSGIVIYLLMMATAFLGYVLPWGQMSFWAATVITNIITALPFGDGGESFAIWLWGGYSVDNPTLNRFFSLHYLLPFVIAALVIVHIFLLHDQGSTDPCLHAKHVDVIRFYPYFYYKDLFGLFLILILFSLFVFFNQDYLGHPDNYVKANPLVTPKHIVPEWYFLPFYGLLRSIPNKFAGIALMLGAIVFLLLLPLFISNKVISNSLRGYSFGLWSWKYTVIYRIFFCFFCIDFVILGWLGSKPVEVAFVWLGLFATFFYYLFFFIVRFIFIQDKKFFVFY